MVVKITENELQNFLKIDMNKTHWWIDSYGPYIFRDVQNNLLGIRLDRIPIIDGMILLRKWKE